MRRPSRTRLAALAVGVVLSAAGVLAAAQGWTPPAEGAVAMFRKAERIFSIGARSGGAGGLDGNPVPEPPDTDSTPTERTMTFDLVPMERWDEPGGPLGHELSEGTVFLYRRGDYSPRIVGEVGEEISLPVGTWYLVGESPAGVTTFGSAIRVQPGQRGSGNLTQPVVPACEVRWAGGEDGAEVERIDLVSVEETAVLPIVPGRPGPRHIPAGRFLAYSVSGDEIVGLTTVRRCEPGVTAETPTPTAPAAGRQALIVEIPLRPATGPGPPTLEAVVNPDADERGDPQRPEAWVRGFGAAVAFFPDLAAGAIRLDLAPAAGLAPGRRLPPATGTVRHIRW